MFDRKKDCKNNLNESCTVLLVMVLLWFPTAWPPLDSPSGATLPDPPTPQEWSLPPEIMYQIT